VRLFENAAYWRKGLTDLGFDLLPGDHPIIPVMLGDAVTVSYTHLTLPTILRLWYLWVAGQLKKKTGTHIQA